LLLICSGGMVTSKGVGLAVPDWPTTFGYNMFLFPVSKWVGGIFFEHTHRLIASLVGFLTIILALWTWRVDSRRWVRMLGFAALGAVILQGVLGGLRVTMLKDEVGIFHACLAQAFLGSLVVIAVVTSGRWMSLRSSTGRADMDRIVRWAVITAIAVYIQLALGATMRHQHRDLSIMDFPLAYGQIIPATDSATMARINRERDAQALSDVSPGQIWLQMAHRFLAAIIGLVITWFWFQTNRQMAILRKLASLWLGLVIAQIALGAWVIWSNKAADIATTHVAVGALTFATGIIIAAALLRLQHGSEIRMPAHQTAELVPVSVK